MENLSYISLLNHSICKLFIPNGIGPFPSVIILKQYKKGNQEISLDYYARTINDIGFLAFTFLSIAGEHIEILNSHLNLVIEYLISRPEVDKKKIFLLIVDPENKVDIKIDVFDDRIQAMASLSWLSPKF